MRTLAYLNNQFTNLENRSKRLPVDHGLQPDQICKLASNENPWGPSALAIEAAKEALEKLHLYPDGSGHQLISQLATHHSLEEDQFVLGNGSNEIIELLGHVFLEPGDEVVCGEFAFVVYKLVALLMGAKPVEVEMPGLVHNLSKMKEAISEKTKLVFLPSPNNPTGTANSEAEIYQFVRSLPEHIIFCFDEAYAEYLDQPTDLRPLIREGRKVICLRTFPKFMAWLPCELDMVTDLGDDSFAPASQTTL